MQSSGTVLPDAGVPADDIRALYERGGPYVTVIVTTDGRVEKASERNLQRWRPLRQALEQDGAPEAVLDHVEAAITDAHQRGRGTIVVADETGVQLEAPMAEPPEADRATWSRLPDVVPLIRARQDQVSHIIVLADRGGADVVGVAAGQVVAEAELGDGEPERKSNPGGWSQRRFQQRAEEDWAETAREVAGEVAKLADDQQPRLIVLGGDVRAVQLLTGDLPDRWRSRLHTIDHGRAEDGSDDARQEEIGRLVATAVAEDTVEVLDRFREELGQEDRAVGGATATVAALERASVGLLLVHDTDRSAHVGDDPLPISLEGPVDGADHEVRLVDALVAAALATGAGVRVVPASGPVPEGIGAILRWGTDGELSQATT